MPSTCNQDYTITLRQTNGTRAFLSEFRSLWLGKDFPNTVPYRWGRAGPLATIFREVPGLTFQMPHADGFLGRGCLFIRQRGQNSISISWLTGVEGWVVGSVKGACVSKVVNRQTPGKELPGEVPGKMGHKHHRWPTHRQPCQLQRFVLQPLPLVWPWAAAGFSCWMVVGPAPYPELGCSNLMLLILFLLSVLPWLLPWVWAKAGLFLDPCLSCWWMKKQVGQSPF